MLTKLKKKHDELDFSNINIICLLLSVVFLGISLFITRNIYIIIICFLYVYEVFYHGTKNKYLKFLISILPIIILACFLVRYIELPFIKVEIEKVFQIIINILIFIAYIIVVIGYIKEQHIRYIRKSFHQETLKDLRIKNIKVFHDANLELIKNYQSNNQINSNSDYYKVMKDNLKTKTITDLEDYITLNYLRFYRNKKSNYHHLDKFNLEFIIINIIILLLAILVR